ncbi:DUF3040 domain-containing protein [Planomonospora parontospora]|uniref:DUF3040 domain-containing protein n=1 Tax=Planomonospora parontospora TaxID=58119 RepID=UPI001670C9D6|nr:DUF3040 domain-containing protein [Planomonospora parontospora]GGL02989.1 hypothetical protein GCM10014719_01510 [Planomonospora parontospora subsp. antibiotica]GII13311.1 hypothetical protein Ppa05_00370 [Planomonospora parontospora subsp. antibiotica]
MSLSRRESQILAEIEQSLRRQDRAFACRMDALNAARPARGVCHRFGYTTSRRELVCVVAATFILTAVLVVLTLALPDRPCTLRSSPASAGPTISEPPSSELPAEVRRPACRP